MSDPRCVYDHSNAGECSGELYNPDRFGNALCDFHRRMFSVPTWDHVDELSAKIELLLRIKKTLSLQAAGLQTKITGCLSHLNEAVALIEDGSVYEQLHALGTLRAARRALED